MNRVLIINAPGDSDFNGPDYAAVLCPVRGFVPHVPLGPCPSHPELRGNRRSVVRPVLRHYDTV